jgi:serine protease
MPPFPPLCRLRAARPSPLAALASALSRTACSRAQRRLAAAAPVRARRRLSARRLLVLLTVGAGAIVTCSWSSGQIASGEAPSTQRGGIGTTAPPYVPGELVVEYRQGTPRTAQIASVRSAGAESESTTGEGQASEGPVRVLHLRAGVSVQSALARLRESPGVSWAAPDYVAHAAGAGQQSVTPPSPAAQLAQVPLAPAAPFIPDNVGSGNAAGDWQELQWNFTGSESVEATQAWGNLIADHAPGGRGVIVAVLDTGIAYRNWKRYLRSPGFRADQFVAGYDFVTPGQPPVDHNGHGTFVAGEIAEATNIQYGLTGLAYGVRLMPVRVLDSAGEGDALTIARGIRYAVKHHAQIINLSLEFPAAISAAEVPELTQALRYANEHGVLVVAAAGNDSDEAVPYPARAEGVVAVGATTEHGCLADYSNFGHHVALVAPGGGPDANLPGDPGCHPEDAPGRDIFQVTFLGASPRRFGMPAGYEGTSMATPEVSATAALIIASGVLGRHPTTVALEDRLRATARPLGDPSDRYVYGAGLLDAAAATAPGGPGGLL